MSKPNLDLKTQKEKVQLARQLLWSAFDQLKNDAYFREEYPIAKRDNLIRALDGIQECITEIQRAEGEIT